MRIFRKLVITIFVISLGLYVGVGLWNKITNDKTIPEIYTDEVYLEMSVNEPSDKLLDRLTATDEKDGDLTDSIMIQSMSNFIEKGELIVKYVVFDHDNNFAKLSRKVKYTDYRSPEFSLTEPLEFTRNKKLSIQDYVQATDLLDGDISDKVKITGTNVDMSTAGVYPITLEVTNSHGDRAVVDVNVIVRDSGSVSRILLSDYLLYVDQGSTFRAEDYIDSIITSSGEKLQAEGLNVYDSGAAVCSIHVSGEVDTDVPGCYQLEYSYQTSRSSGFTCMTVVVRE